VVPLRYLPKSPDQSRIDYFRAIGFCLFFSALPPPLPRPLALLFTRPTNGRKALPLEPPLIRLSELYGKRNIRNFP
jgi:hypothetical protein